MKYIIIGAIVAFLGTYASAHVFNNINPFAGLIVALLVIITLIKLVPKAAEEIEK